MPFENFLKIPKKGEKKLKKAFIIHWLDNRHFLPHNWRMSNKILNLQAQPQFEKKVLSLIEKSFGYKDGTQFKTDFYPLMNEGNLQNCYFIMLENEAIAHVGILPQVWRVNGNRIPVLYIGGIAVDEKHRGQGLFKELMEHIFSIHKHYALYILWSDQVDMYKKFGFHLALEQIEVPKTKSASQFLDTKLNELNKNDITDLNELYNHFWKDSFHYTKRDRDSWEKLSHITTADLFIKRNGNEITDYFFMNKGSDLNGIIYEFASKDELPIKEMSSHGKIWLPSLDLLNIDVEYEKHFGCLMKIGSETHFANFVSAYSNNAIEVLGLKDGEVYFAFNDENLALPEEEFLTGLMGPGVFEEFSSFHKPVFISGLDSI